MNYNDQQMYEASQAQFQQIEKEIMETSPLVSKMYSIYELGNDFASNEIFLSKVKGLNEKYSGFRRLRRDGNCFYRAFFFAYMDYIVRGKRVEEARNFKNKCDECKNTLVKEFGYNELTVEDFHESVIELLNKMVLQEEATLSDLESYLNDDTYSNYYVVFMRLLVSSYIQKNPNEYIGYIDNYSSIKAFCDSEVEPMSRDVDQLHVAVLARATEVGILVENCQSSGDLNELEFPGKVDDAPVGDNVSDSRSWRDPFPVKLFYRPGHYDMLCK